MSETPNLGISLLEANQAQKHVTVNEAITRLDAFVGRRAESASTSTPPSGATNGQVWIVGSNAVSDWAGQDSALAYFVNGGWDFRTPSVGEVFWVLDVSESVCFDGVAWQPIGAAVGSNGATTRDRVLSFTHTLAAGAISSTAEVIPSHAIVRGVTVRVTDAITGSGVTGVSIGVAGASNRYGSGVGISLNSWSRGVTGQPVTYYSDEPIVFSAEGGTFDGGEVAVAVHLTELLPPSPV